jgi:hypothetical protein
VYSRGFSFDTRVVPDELRAVDKAQRRGGSGFAAGQKTPDDLFSVFRSGPSAHAANPIAAMKTTPEIREWCN